ncbi:MAG: stage 0 sporulation family protein [Bacilli bacterium]|nr:stage 0 sporulation family protein [Bacilli bacterium]
MEEKLACVRFNNVGKSYYFSTDLDIKKGEKVVVETVRGLELGEVVSDLKDLSEFNLETELKPIKRRANRADEDLYIFNKTKAEKSLEICKEIVSHYDLDMHLISCEYTLDASKVIFMYTSETRVDFRQLLRELASVFKCRIELRQIGPRDKAKIVGGIGSCGLQLCCSSFLGEFDGVSINMAKNQLLAINIDKISGSCGRLLCCLKYEDDTYTEAKKRFPKIGSKVKYENKIVKVVGLNVISDLVKIDDEGNISFVKLSEVKSLPPLKKEKNERSN